MMKKLMIDLDDVIFSSECWINIVNEFLNSNYTFEDVEGYYVDDLVPNELKEDFINYLVSKNIYNYGRIYDDAINVIKKLNKKYEIYICTAYVFRDHISYSAESLKIKFNFITKNFPFLNPKNIIFAGDKSIIDCDIKIDDKVSNLVGAETKILYKAYHNKDMDKDKLKQDGIIMVSNWKEIERILLEEV